MAVSIHNLIAAIVPDIYCEKEIRAEVKKLAKEKGYLEAAKKAKPVESEYMNLNKEIYLGNAFKGTGLKNPIEKHVLVYDAFSQSLEPIYFWILDYINLKYDDSEKLIDNFVTSPGSAQFGEVGRKMTFLQEEVMKLMQTSGVLIKSILNLVYDLKEFQIRLNIYDDLKSKDEKKKNAALLNLKQIWMDQVDAVKRGNTSIKGLAMQFEYVTLIDAFMAADSLEKVEKLDLNDRVKNILRQRVHEFFKWVELSEKDLRKRFEIEKIYLKNQVNSIKMYSRWIKPYLISIKNLEQKTKPDASLVTTFNTSLMELVLLGKMKYKIEIDIGNDVFPNYYTNYNKKKYQEVVIVSFKFRSIPERMTQKQDSGYGYRGRVEIEFTSYALTEKEIEILLNEVSKDDLGDLMELVGGMTEESLEKFRDDLDNFLSEGKKEEKEKKNSNDVNPFSALFEGILKKKEKKEEGITKDSKEEENIRNRAIIWARMECNSLYEAFKGYLGMPGF